ncbi:hypothetical protein [Endozoicomonas sp. 4G]|uniref:hypothetical protein n=1 Tax=Endozoicomonas sp. 4G TaxID=2872754 RepID=UPI002078B4C3|nr:hypothetical protein [Endozoicomonas sp. 4G]
MLSKKPLTLTLAIVFSLYCSNGHAQENRLPLLSALTVGKALIKTPKPFIEFSSTNTRIMLLPDESEESEAMTYCRAASDDSANSEDSDSEDSGSEDSDTSDENSDNRSDEADVQYATTTLNPFRVSNEMTQYCATLTLKKIKQEPSSDIEIATEPEAEVTEVDSSKNLEVTSPAFSSDHMGHLKTHRPRLPADRRPRASQCDHEGCNYSTRYTTHLKRHKKTHLPADQRPKVHQCGHEGCNFRTDLTANLKTHKQTHLPIDQRARVYQCDHEGCNFRTDLTTNLKMHKQIHLPVGQRLKRHQCDHEGCNHGTNRVGDLKRHKQTHLPFDQRDRMYQCNHKGCSYSTNYPSNLQKHKQTHLPADKKPKRPKRSKLHRCDHKGCNYITNNTGHLKEHKQCHLPADQRIRRPRVHRCNHEGCNFSTNMMGNLKKHKQTHLPADQDEAEPGVQYVITTLNPFRVSNEISQYCAALEPKKIKQEPDSDNEIPTESEVDETGPDSVKHQEITSRTYSTDQTGRLKMYEQIHQPAHQKSKLHQCDHEGCNYSTNKSCNLNRHKQTHLPADQRPKRPKRKAYDQPPSNEKRKKGHQE